jgi:hypothetical protein
LGNSHVWRGFNPDVFGLYYQEITGQPILCQNFGVRGINAVAAGDLATLLVAEFHPSLFIFATSAGDYDTARGLEASNSIIKSPWVQYQLGYPTFDGWLVENSYAYRYYLGLRTTLLPVSLLQKRDITESEEQTQLNGFAPIPNSKIWQSPQDNVENYVVDPDQMVGVQEILNLKTQTEILVVEMPVNPVTFKGPGMNEKRDQFVTLVSKLVSLNGKQLWLTQDLNLIPDDAWADFHHLGKTGANIFSAWLGKRVGEAVMDGTLTLFYRGGQ